MHGFLGFGHKEHTAEERVAAVQELRQRLTTNPGSPPALLQLQRTHEAGIGDGWDDQTLLRWLTAETFHVDRAEARIRKNAAWRAEYIPKGFILKACLARQCSVRLDDPCCRVLVRVQQQSTQPSSLVPAYSCAAHLGRQFCCSPVIVTAAQREQRHRRQ